MIFDVIVNLSKVMVSDESVESDDEDLIAEQFFEIDIEKGLSNCDSSKNTYNSFLNDFLSMYGNAVDVLEETLSEKRYEEAKSFADDLGKLAEFLGAQKVAQSALEMQKTFEKESYNKLPVLLNLFGKNLEKLIAEIEKYLQQ